MGYYRLQTHNLVNGTPRLEGGEEEEEKGACHSKSIHPKLLKTLKNPENEYLVCWLPSGLKYHGSNHGTSGAELTHVCCLS